MDPVVLGQDEKKMKRIVAVRGMHDLLPQEFALQVGESAFVSSWWSDGHACKRFVIDKGEEVARKFGYRPISTPLVEDQSLFVRAIGNDTDVVSKELFSWEQSKVHLFDYKEPPNDPYLLEYPLFATRRDCRHLAKPHLAQPHEV